MKSTVKRMLALVLALLLAVPSFAFAEEPVIQSELVDEIIDSTELDFIGDDENSGFDVEFADVDEDTVIDDGEDIDLSDEVEDMPSDDDDSLEDDDISIDEIDDGASGTTVDASGTDTEIIGEDVDSSDGEEPAAPMDAEAEEPAPADTDIPAEGGETPVEDDAVPADADTPAEGGEASAESDSAPAEDDAAPAEDDMSGEDDIPSGEENEGVFYAVEAVGLIETATAAEAMGALFEGETAKIYGFSTSTTFAPSDDPEKTITPKYYVGDGEVGGAQAGSTVTVKLVKGSKVIITDVSAVYAESEDKVFGPNAEAITLPLTKVDDLNYTLVMPEGYVGINIVGYIEGETQSDSGSSLPGGLVGPPISITDDEHTPHSINYPSSGVGFNAAVGCYGHSNIVSSAVVGTVLTLYLSGRSGRITITAGDESIPYAYNNDKGGYDFTMLDKDVEISIEPADSGSSDPSGEPEPVEGGEHTIHFAFAGEYASYGKIIAYKNGTSVKSADAGNEIQVTAYGTANGFYCSQLTLTSGTEVTTLQGSENGPPSFIMPRNEVTLTATIAQSGSGNGGQGGNEPRYFTDGDHTVSVSESEHGSIQVTTEGMIAKTANAGNWLEFDVNAEDGYVISGITASYGGVTRAAKHQYYSYNDSWKYEFTMPDADVTFQATFVKAGGNAINIDSGLVNGNVYASLNNAVAGTTVTVCGVPNDGYDLGTITVTGPNDSSVPVTDNTFTMPDGEVTVSATFVSSDTVPHDIEIHIQGEGAVSADQTSNIMSGTTVTLTVTPENGYKLQSLYVYDRYDEEVTVSENNTFTMPACEVNVHASFVTVDTHTINYQPNLEHGSIYGPETAKQGDTVTLTIGPETGYKLDELTVTGPNDSTVTVTDNTFTMPEGDVTVSATFVEESVPATRYSIDINDSIANGSVTAKVNGVAVDSAAEDDEVTLVVTPNEGFELAQDGLHVYQNGDEVPLINNTFTMPSTAVTIEATFTAIQYSVTIDNGIRNGTLTVDDATAAYGETVTLTATPNDGYELDGLTISYNGETTTIDDSYTFEMPAYNVTVAASFKPINYTVTIDANIVNGTVSANTTDEAHISDTITLTVSPATGYELESLTYALEAEGDAIAITPNENGVYGFAMPAGNVTVAASFRPINYTVTVDANIVNGTVSASKTNEAHIGDTIILTVSPATGYELESLTYALEAGGDAIAITPNEYGVYGFAMPAGDVVVAGTFVEIGDPGPGAQEYDIYWGSDADFNTNDVVIGYKYWVDDQEVSRAKENDVVTVQCTYDSTKCTLVRLTWTYGDVTHDLDLENPTFTMPAGNVSIRARFTQQSVHTGNYKFHYNESHGSSSIAQVNGSYALSANAGDSVNVYVTEPQGWLYEGVTVTYGTTTLDLGAYQSFEMPASDVTITPVLSPAHTGSYRIEVTGGPQGGGSAYVDNVRATSANAGETVELRINANNGYELTGANVNYTLNGTQQTDSLTANNLSFTMPAADVTVTPLFSDTQSGGGTDDPISNKAYSIDIVKIGDFGTATATSSSSQGRQVVSADEYEIIYLSIIPNNGYHTRSVVVSYGDQEEDVSAESKFTMPGADVTVKVTFEQNQGGSSSGPDPNDTRTIELSEANFPDEAFRNYMIQTYDGQNGGTKDGVLNAVEIYGVESRGISLGGNEIHSVQGVELFENLKSLRMMDMSGPVDISSIYQCANLETLVLGNVRGFTTLEFSGFAKLTELTVNSPGVTEVTVKNCSNLNSLSVSGNSQSVLTIANCPSLTYLAAERNSLSELDISGCSEAMKSGVNEDNYRLDGTTVYYESDDTTSWGQKLNYLSCDANVQITGGTAVAPVVLPDPIDINETNFPDAAFRAYISGYLDGDKDGKLSAIEMDQITGMHIDEADEDDLGGKIMSLQGLELFTKVTVLQLGDKLGMTNLDLSQYTRLTCITFENTQVKTLDVSGCTELESLECPSNALTSLDISHNAKLSDLVVSNNYLSELDISANGELSFLIVYGNANLGQLDISKCSTLVSNVIPENRKSVDGHIEYKETITSEWGYSYDKLYLACDEAMKIVTAEQPVEEQFSITTAIAEGSEGRGAIEAPNTSAANKTVVVTVIPNTGYELDVLSVKQGDDDIEVAGNSFTMPEGDVIVTASFKPIDYTVTIDDNIVNGTVSAGTIDKVHIGDTITLTVSPARGYELESLTYALAAGEEAIAITPDENGVYGFAMPAGNVTVAASFKPINYTVTVDADIVNGTVSASATDEAHIGDAITLTVTPTTGYELESLTYALEAGGGAVPIAPDENGSYGFIMPAGNVTVTASFKPINYTVTVDTNIVNGTVSASKTDGAHIGDAITLTVFPATGYMLESLTYALAAGGEAVPIAPDENGAYGFTMPAGNVTVAASFQPINYTVTVDTSIVNGTVSANKTNEAHIGDAITLTVSPATGYELQSLTYALEAGGDAIAIEPDENGAYGFIMPAGNVSVTASFVEDESEKTYAISVDYNENGEGYAKLNEKTVTTAKAGTTLSFSFYPHDGYEPVGASVKYSNGDNYVYINNPTGGAIATFTMPASDVTITLEFKAIGGNNQGGSDTPGGLVGPIITDATYQVNYPSSGDGFTAAVGYNGKQVQSAEAGWKLKLYVQASSFNFSIIDATGEPVDYDYKEGGYEFTMPASHVTIAISANGGSGGPSGDPVPVAGGEHSITITDSEHGKAYAQRNGTYVFSANKDDPIRIEPRPNQYYQPTGVTVTDQSGKVINGYSGTGPYDPWAFTMPGGPVTVTVNYVYSVNIVVNPDNFPDENLRNALMRYAHQEGSDYVVSSGNISYLELNNVSNYKGLEFLTNLTRLVISGDQLTTLTLQNDVVTSVMLANCGNLTTVDLSDCPNLNDLNFEWNTPKISSLDVSGCTKLTSLQARGAALKTLDVSHNTELTHLDCNSNQLTTLDVSKNTKLESLSCFSNNITQLNLVKNSRLLEYITEENKRDIDDTQEGYTCIAYVNPETEEWVLAHDPGVQVSLAPMFDIVKAYADEGEPRGTVEAPSAAPAGRTVTVTVVPNEGYALQGIEATDDTGAIQITDVSEGVYTFTMPEGEVTITARFIPTLVITAPEAIPDLVYNGETQALVTAAETNGGTLQYSLDGEHWGETIPTGTDAGSYNVYYQVIDSEGYYGDGTGAEPVAVEIARKPVNVTAASKTKTYGETDPELTYTPDGLIGTDELDGALGREEGEDVGDYAITQGTLSAGNNYEIILNDATLTITKKALTVTAEDKTKVYGDTDPTLTWTAPGLVGDDTLSGALTRVEGEDVKEGGYAIEQGTLVATANYDMTFVPGKLTITKKALTVTAEDKTKVYGEDDPELTWTAPGLVGDDTLTGTLTRVEGEDVKEGGYAIEQGTLAATDNYQMSFVPGKLTITPAALTVTAMPRTKVYGEDDPKLTYTVTGLVGDDKVTGELERVAGEDVKEGGYAIGQGSLTAGGNYEIAYTPSTLTITPAALTVTPDALSVAYGEEDPVLTATVAGLIEGDAETVALTRAEGGNVGSYAIELKSCVIKNKAEEDVTANYNLTFTEGVMFTIRPKKITAVADAKSKTYGESDPVLTYTVADGQLVGSDTQAEVLTGSLTRAAGENVGSYAITKGTLKSASDNYELVFQTARLTINKKALAVTAEDKTKTYGDADPTLTWTAPDLVEGDALTGALTRAEGEDVGEYAITQGTLAAGDNYTMDFNPGKLTVNKRLLTVTPDAVEKTYGETDPALTYTVAGELVGADALTGALEREPGETAGTYAIARGTLSAGDNYDIELGAAALTINKRPLTITIDAKAKLLDATEPELTYTVTGLAEGDEATIELTREAGETVGAYPITLKNYAIKKDGVDVTTSYDVTYNHDAKLTIGNNVINVTAKDATKTYGDNDPALEYEATIPDGGALTGALGRVQGEDAGTYAITQGTLQPNAGYVLNFVGANLTIEKAALTVTPDDAEKTYGEADPELTYAVDGLVNGDAAEAVLTGALGRETGENAGTYAIAQGTLAANNNYTLTVATDSKLTIAAKALTVTAKDAEKTYGDADPAFDYDVDGLVNGDAKEAVLTGTLARDEGVDVNEAGYAITQGELQSKSPNYTVDSFVPAKLTINRKDITVKVTTTAEHGLSKAYGANDPTFEYEAADGAVVAGDTLNISREAGEKVGLYAFTADNANYNVAFMDGEAEQRFEITPKTLTSLTWSTEELVYNGSGLKPTATVIGNDLENGDTCYVNVNAIEINGQDGKATVIDAVDAGDYTAEAASLTNPNYKLPENTEITRHTFAISKASSEAQTVAREVTVSFHGVKDGRVDLTNYLKDATAWNVVSRDDLITAAAPEGNALVYSTMDTEGTEISTGSVVINVQSKNYNDSTLTVNFRTSTAFALRFESNGGPQEASRSLAAGDKIKDYLPAAAERDGYELKGWYLDAALTDPVSEYNAMGESDATVYAKWAPITYTIQLTDPDGYHSAEDNLNPITYTVATDPSTPSLTLPILKDNKSGSLSFTFIGWKELGEAGDVEPRLDVTIDPASMVNTTYVAQWKQGEVAGKVAFENAGGGSGLQGVQGLDSKNEASTDDDAPTTSLANAMKAIANENMTEETADSKITVEMNISASSKDAEAKAAIKEAVAPPQAEGVTQSTDFMEITITSETTMAAGEPTEDPVVLDQRTVSDAGRVVEIPLKYDMTGRYNPVITRHHRDENGTSVTPLRRLTRRPSGSEMKDGTFYIEGSGANATVYVYSQLFSTLGMTYDDSGELQVYFDYNNGTAPQEVVVRENEKLQRPEEDPVREGNETYAYVFDKWYADPACKTPYNFDAPVTRNNMTVYAGWKRYAIVDVTVEGFTGRYDKAEHNVTVKIENDNPDIDVYFGEAELTKENYKDGSMTVQSETMPTEKTYHWYAEATDCVANPASGVVTINVQKLPSAVTTAPKAQSLTYNGGAQALVSAGKASGGTLKYALGTSASSAPASGWSTSVPTAVNAGTYYVWYKVEGTSVYADVKPACVTVTVSAPAAQAAPQAATPQPEPIPTIPVLKKSVKKTISAAPGSVYQIELGGKTGKSFKSSKKKVATVSATGLITIKAAGKTKITLKVGKKKRTLILKVKDPTVPTRIALNAPGGTAVKVGESQTLTVTLPEGTNSGIKWKSSNKKIATVNAQGVVTFKKAGKVTITATAVRGKKKAKVKFKVSK